MALTDEQKKFFEQQKAGGGMSVMDYVKDIGQSIPSGLRKNVSSYPGTGGDIYDLLADLGIVTNKAAGATPEQLQALRRGYEADRPPLPTTEDVHQYLTRNPYTPKTKAGQLTEAGVSMIGPRGITKGLQHFMRDVILPLIGSEAGAAIGEQFGPEEAELLSAAGGTAAGPGGEKAKRVAIDRLRGGPLTPEPATSINSLQGVEEPLTAEAPNARAERMRRLRDRGIDVTGGQALGSEFVKRWEAGPYSTKGGAQNEAQARQFSRAALESVGINADIASPEVMAAGQQRFGQFYEDLIRQNNGLPLDPTLQQRMIDIGTQFEGTKGTAAGTHVERFFNRIIDAASQHGGVIPPDVFNAIHSELSATIQKISKAPENSDMTGALRDMQDALYDTIGRNGQPEIQEQAQQLNNRYRNFKIIQKAVGGAGEGVSFGLVSPEKLRAELERRDPAAYTQGRGDLNQLARDAQSLTAMPISGTGAQLASSGLSGLATTALVNMPASGILTSRPVRTAIVNRAIGDHPAFFDPMQLPPILSQAAGQEEIETLPYPGMPVPVEAEPGGAIAPAEAAPMPPEPPAPVDVVPDFLQQGSLEPNPLALRRGIPLNTRRFIG